MSIDVMKQALEALEYIHTETSVDEDELIHPAIIALRAAIEQAQVDSHEKAAAYIDARLWEFIDMAAAWPEAKPALRTWDHAMVYAPKTQEPVCDKDPQGCWNVRCQLGKVCKHTPRQWQGLTDEEIRRIELTVQGYARQPFDGKSFDRAIEAELKRKNT